MHSLRLAAMPKAHLRSIGLAQRKLLSREQRQLFSHTIMMSLFEHLSIRAMSGESNAVESLLSYRSVAAEVSTDLVWKNLHFNAFAPVTGSDANMCWLAVDADTGWKKGVFDVLEPVAGAAWQPGEATSIVLCPLTAFDRQGNRLGMGKGCFDRWLSQHHEHIEQVIGLAFSCQEVAHVPVESHDVAMDYVITEKEVVACMNH